MKWIILLLLAFVFIVLLTSRFRRQISAAIFVWKSLKDPESGKKQVRTKSTNFDNLSAVELVKCATCGSWTPERNSLLLNSMERFCSQKCLDESVAVKKKGII